MDYHHDRFEDFSLMIYKKDKLVAVFPANRVEDKIYSHQGLTYGGVILPPKIAYQEVIYIFENLVNYYKNCGIKAIIIKQIPEIYFNKPSFELDYILGQRAELYRRNMILAIDYSRPIEIHKTKLKHYKQTKSDDFDIQCCDRFTPFWEEVLEPRLKQKYSSKPLHSLKEIQKLHNSFPENIKQFNLYYKNKIAAGITLFITNETVKSQYGATTKTGEKVRALEYLFLHLIDKYKNEGKRFFSMGTVAKDNGLDLNTGLLKQKEELGCNIYIQDFFKLK